MAEQMTNDQWLESQCSRYVNGSCHALPCLARAGEGKKLIVDHTKATCIPHEILCELKRLRKECD